jgi:hypothetical protein
MMRKKLELEFNNLFSEIENSTNIIYQSTVKDILRLQERGWFTFEKGIDSIKYSQMIVNTVEKEILPNLPISNESKVVRNRYGAGECSLNPTQIALYNYILQAETQFNGTYYANEELIRKYNSARMYFRFNWLNEYMTLVD